MFGDPDTLWHLATGDLIRSTGHIPQHDTWSFTADEKPWQNISWAWDVILSDVYEQTGWHGLVIMNSLTIAATLSLIFATCFIRSQHGIASFIVTLLVVAILPNNIRPYQISYLFTATLVLLLSQIVRNQCSRGGFLAIPILMIAWVNIHGGFLIAFFLLGMLGLDTLLQKNWRFAGWLIATGIASIIACLINPYGTDIATATLRYMSSDTSFVSEYQPLTLSRAFGFADLYIFLFFMLVKLRPANVPKNEKWAAYIWLFLGMTAIRHVSIFSIIAPCFCFHYWHTIVFLKEGQSFQTIVLYSYASYISGSFFVIQNLFKPICIAIGDGTQPNLYRHFVFLQLRT